MTSNRHTRRNLMSMLCASTFVLAVPAFAISTSAAQNYVQGAISNLEALVNSGKSGGALQSDVKRFFRKYADVPIVARAVIGAPWRGMSRAQQSAYVAAFEGYVVRKYANLFGVFRGGKSEILRARDGGKAGVLVDAQFVKAGSAPSKLSVQVSDAGGSPKILDLKIEGVSLIGTEREQVRAILAQNGNSVDKLVTALNGR